MSDSSARVDSRCAVRSLPDGATKARNVAVPRRSLAVFVVLCATTSSQAELTLDQIPFNGQRSYEYLIQICDLGPRPSGSPGMVRQRKLLTQHFQKLGAKVKEQAFRARHPIERNRVPMANLIVQWHPKAKERVLLCAHYDTRPLPDNDPNPLRRRNGRFVGANDGASGVALLMELGHMMANLAPKYGVDFVFFDGEELVYGGRFVQREAGEYFLGSTWFAREYVDNPPEHRYRWGVLLDMVADADLQLYQEKHSYGWKDTRPLVKQIWNTAARLGVTEFVARRKFLVKDDHLPLRNHAKIPTCNIIDFAYPVSPANRFWHTEADTPNKCSALSLAKVGWVVHEWLKTMD